MDATIVCERDSHKGIIIGKQGSMLKKIGTNARYAIDVYKRQHRGQKELVMTQKRIHTLSLLAAITAAVIFGMSFMFSKLALEKELCIRDRASPAAAQLRR